MTDEMIAEALGKSGHCVCPGFLSPTMLEETRADLDAVFAAGEFRRAGTGKGSEKAVHDLVRRDEIHWFTETGANAVQAALLTRLQSLRLAFNRSLFLGLNDFEGHYAVYPEGGFYRRHLDSFVGDDARVVSLIIYLNHDWERAHGGALRVYYKDGKTQEIFPEGGKLVCFLSQEFEHEVLLSHRERASFTGWFKCGSIL